MGSWKEWSLRGVGSAWPSTPDWRSCPLCRLCGGRQSSELIAERELQPACAPPRPVTVSTTAVRSSVDASKGSGLNQLLASLPPEEMTRWRPQLEESDMPLGQVLYEPGTTLSHVYFPTTAIVSLLYVMENGASAEIAVVGSEGIVGISLFMGGESTPSRAVVQSAGRGFRLQAQLMKNEFNRAGPVLHLLLRYTQALITQMAQTAVLQPAPFARPAALPLAAPEPRPPDRRRAGHDPGTDRQHAGRASRGRHRKCPEAAACRPDPLFARPHHRHRS